MINIYSAHIIYIYHAIYHLCAVHCININKINKILTIYDELMLYLSYE